MIARVDVRSERWHFVVGAWARMVSKTPLDSLHVGKADGGAGTCGAAAGAGMSN